MSTTMQVAAPDDAVMMAKAIDSFVTRGDWSALEPKQRAQAYVNVCNGLGLNPASMPLSFLRLNGKDVLYVSRGATDQLAARHKLNREIIDGPKVVDIAGTKIALAVCKATLPGGRFETATATLPIQDPPNLFMKLETKAKRRATLSVLGLGIMDESEVDNIPAKDRSEPLTVVDPELVRAQVEAPTTAPTATAVQTNEQPPGEPDEAGEIASEEAPASRAFARFVEQIGAAATLVVICTLYQALLADLHEEGNDVAQFCDGDDGAAAMARRRMVSLGHRLAKAEGSQVLMSRPLAEIIDAQVDVGPGPDALQTAARWWIAHRGRVTALDQAHRGTPWYALVRRYAAAGDATATKRAGAALEAAVRALDKSPPPTGTDGGRNGGGGSSATATATATSAAASSAPTAARAMLEQFREHLHAKPRDTRNPTRELSEVAASYLKRVRQFDHAGVRRQALDITRAELRSRGCDEPDAILNGVSQHVYGRAV